MNRGNLFVVSGFSGAGKGTVMEWFRADPRYALSVSCTSRKPRPGEEEGIHYYYISHEEFVSRAEGGFFLEHAIYADHGYGTPKQFVEENLAAGKDVILEIELQGAMQVKSLYPDTVLIFITPPSIEELIRRLNNRGSETEAERKKRLLRAVEEGKNLDKYDYIVVNDVVEDCRAHLHHLMESMHQARFCNGERIAMLQGELSELHSRLSK